MLRFAQPSRAHVLKRHTRVRRPVRSSPTRTRVGDHFPSLHRTTCAPSRCHSHMTGGPAYKPAPDSRTVHTGVGGARAPPRLAAIVGVLIAVSGKNIVTRCAYTLMRAHVPRVHSCADASLALCLAASATIVARSLRPIIDGSSSFSARYARASRALIRAMLAVETCTTSQIHVSPLDARTPVRTSHVGTHVPTRLSRYLRYNHCDTTAVPRSFVCTAAREEGKPSCAHLPLRTPPPRPAERTNGAWHRGLVEVSISSFSRVPRFVRSARSARFRRSQRDGQTARALAHSHRFRPRDPPQRRPPTEPWAPPYN